ncbi:MAG: hypothetical protein FWD57_02460 [Polyangiaceae bacterium]|nr:hypothetical protein [Polyangiaceae bacterium]
MASSDAPADMSACTKEHREQSSTSSVDESVPTAHTPIGTCVHAQMLSGGNGAIDAHNVMSVKH